jgi:hypothetical protein
MTTHGRKFRFSARGTGCRKTADERWTQDCIASNMDWKPGGVSDDVEDRRDSSGGGGGGFSGMGFGAPHIGIGGMLLLLVLSLVFHRNLFTMFLGGSGYGPARRYLRSGGHWRSIDRGPVRVVCAR